MNRIFIQHISFVCILLVSLIIFPTKLFADPKSILYQENEYGISIQSYNSMLYYSIQTKQDVLKLHIATNGKEAFHIFKNVHPYWEIILPPFQTLPS